MSPPNSRRADQPRRLLWPFVALLLLSIALQAASLVALLEIDATLARSRQHVEVAASQQALVEQFENSTYLALVGLATSDWEVLLRQQATVQELTERFADASTAMLHGGQVELGDLPVTVASIEDLHVRRALSSIPSLWGKAYAAHVRVLRSDNRALKQNPDLEQFRIEIRRLSESLGEVSALIQRRAHAETLQLERLQRLIPVGTFLVTLGIFAFVLGRILLPFVGSTEELGRARDELEQRLKELKEAQRHAVELARQAGMAELATNVLHNVGNVLNSINTASTILGERLRALRVEPLLKVAGMFEERRADLATFVTTDERGQRLPEYLGKLGQHLSTERDELRGMTADLQRHVEHIRMIVELQQTYATSSSIVEPVSLEELVEDARRISTAALGRHGISFEFHTVSLPRLMLDRHKLLQILLNLISNAKYAMNHTPEGERRLEVRIDRPEEKHVRVRVIDNGMGIAPELLTKIFQHGFTTRKEGHGFGLHSCAIAASALGGSLVAHSDGPGHGATFTLELPYRPEASSSADTGSERAG